MSILINIASEFTGKKAFKEAQFETSRLEKNVKELGKTLGIALSTAAVVAYGKAAVKAFTEDEAATIRLTNAVENLGFAFANADIQKFIANLEATAGIADDTLRPAFQALLTTTKDLNASYKLLNDSIAISRGSGVDLATVAQDLANGYTGVTRGLRKYNTGLTQAELKSKSFSDILTILNGQFAGANQAYLDTYSYKLDVLTVAAGNAKETIGGGLIDAFARIGGGSEVQDAVKAIDNIAKAVNGITMAVATVIGGLAKLYKALDFVTSFGGLTGANGKLVGGGDQVSKTTAAITQSSKVQLKASTALTKATKTNTAELKKQALAKKQSALFDIEQIQIIAALKGDISEQERLRLKLQLALATENETEAAKLSQQLANSIDKTGNLARFLTTLPDAKNPFASWSAYLDAIIAKARLAASIGGGSTTTVTPPPTNIAGFNVNMGATTNGVTSSPSGDIIINIQGSVTTEEDLVAKIRAGIQSGSLSGKPSDIGRLAGMFG